MEKYECCEGVECVERCEDCESYEAVQKILRNVQSSFFSIGIERQILNEVSACDDIKTLDTVVDKLNIERHGHLYQYTISKIHERIAILQKQSPLRSDK
jgi:hypothetical protein